MEPASPFKQALGLFLLAVGYLVIAFGVQGLQPGVKVSMIWLVSLYTIHTLGELCLSPIGLSMVNKLAPAKFASLLMGVWFLSTSAANKFAGTLSALYPEPVVAVSTIQEIESNNSITLLPEAFKIDDAQVVDNQKVIPMEKVMITAIKDEAVKENVKQIVESSLVKNPKFFAGFEILTLYDFFMLFVFMAGAASVVLFFLSKKMLSMMGGIR
jgi:POT family proton-dependent oligopeptide transporter